MRIRRRTDHVLAFRGLAAALLLIATSSIHADEPVATPQSITLFDGETLDGWEKTDFYGSGEVEVEEGVIILRDGEPYSSMTGITSTRVDLPKVDYELTYSAKRLGGRDFFAAATFPVNEAFVTLVNGGWGGSITGLSSINGADASENETSGYHEYKNETWYRFQVRVTGRKIVCLVDDEAVVHLDHEGAHLGTRLESRASQPLGFAAWETTGAVRDIAIRPLSPVEVEEINRAEP